MPRSFQAGLVEHEDGVTTVRVGFGEPASNAAIVPDAIAALADLRLPGGRGVKITVRQASPPHSRLPTPSLISTASSQSTTPNSLATSSSSPTTPPSAPAICSIDPLAQVIIAPLRHPGNYAVPAPSAVPSRPFDPAFLARISYVQVAIEFSASAPLELPPFAGSTLRGVFGHALRRPHRYQVTAAGRLAITAILTIQQSSLRALNNVAA